MAENSCSTSSALEEIDLTAFTESSGGLAVAIERCPLCSEAKRNFYCIRCIENGCFFHSKATFPESYVDKLRRWDRLKSDRKWMLERFNHRIQPTLRKAEKSAAIEECKRNVELLRLAIVDSTKNLHREKSDLERLQKENYLRAARGRKHRDKKRRIREHIEKVNSAIHTKGLELNRRHDKLISLRQELIGYLTRFIFTVEEVQSKSTTESMALSDEVQEALKEASHTDYVRGRWVYSDSQYRIVAPTLPCLGDYSQYNTCVATNRENPGSEGTGTGRDPGANISAALCYTSQLISVLAHLLAVNLPKRQCYSDFCSSDMSEKQFNHVVSRLNRNVLYLCFSQGVNPNLLVAKHTLQNVLALLRHPQLGRIGPFDVDLEMMQSVEDSGTQSEESEEEAAGYDDETDLPTDWEAVPLEIPEVYSRPSSGTSSSIQAPETYTSQNLSESTLTASNYMSSAAASVLSFFRGSSDKR